MLRGLATEILLLKREKEVTNEKKGLKTLIVYLNDSTIAIHL